MKQFLRLSVLFLILTLLLPAAGFAQNKDWLLKMQDPNVNFWELQKEFNDYWKSRSDYKSNGYKVFKRWEYIHELRAAPDGKLQAPEEVLLEYERYKTELPQNKSASGTWSLIGPLGYPANNTSQPTGKGRVNAIAFHPTDPNTIYLGSPSGGIWKSVNGGDNWSSLSSNIPYLGVSAILINPSDPDILYIGTGDRDGSDAPGVGVYKSTDGGATWWPANSGMGAITIGMMLMHPSDPNTLLAATRSGIYKTTNGGIAWSLAQSGDFRDIKFKPGHPNIVYATEITTPAKFWSSADNGEHWSVAPTPTSGVGSRMVIGVTPAAPEVVYLLQISNLNATFKALLRSNDGGQTFTEQSNSPNILGYNCDGSGTASQATYDLCIEVDQANEDIVYVGGIISWKSINAGVNWTPVTHWVGSAFAPSDQTANCAASVHADHHVYAWSPNHSPARLYLGGDGGIHYTADGGATWTEISNDLPTGQIYKIGQSAHSANTVSAGFQDNGASATNNGGASFTTIAGGDGTECVIDYSNANICYRASQNGNIGRSLTGIFGSYSTSFISSLTDPVAFVAPYMLHRTVPTTMFFGRENLWRSTNVTSTPSSTVVWEAISNFATGQTIRVMEQSPADVNIVYVSRSGGVNPSVLYRSDNANASAASVTWTVITKPGGFTISDIKAHPTDPNIVYATANRFVYKSTNKGVSWTNISSNLPSLFINCLVLDKDANEGIYIGNQTGVWYKDATLSDWILFSSSLPPVDVRELDIYYDVNSSNSRISAATYGRGLWQSDLAEIHVINPSQFATVPSSTSQIDLSWALNASSNNVLVATSPTTIFGVPADGTSYSAGSSLPGGGTVIYVGSLTNFSHTGLSTGAHYCYKIWSFNGSNQYSAGLPPVCASTFAHNWTGNVNTDWFNTGNWEPAALPTAIESAYIPAGRPNYPLINAAGATCYHLAIESGASLSMDANTSYTLQVTGDWINNGTFTRGVGTVQFNGTNDLQTIKGTSASAFYILSVDKGAQSKILEATSVISLHAPANPLDLFTGTFKLSSASTITPFTDGAAAVIDGFMGLWNNGGTINSVGNFTWLLNAGLLRVSAGTVNVGANSGNSIEYLNNGTLMIEGGALNIAARFVANDPPNSTCQYIQTGGTLTVFTVGSSNTTRAPFYLSPNASFTMSGGAIVVQKQSSNTGGEVVIASTSHHVTGGTLQIGNAATPAAQTIRINSTVPLYNLTVNATNAPTAQLLTNDLTVKNDLTISGGTLNANNLNLNVGRHWTNNGTFTPGAGTVSFDGTVAQNLGGVNATTFNHLTLNNTNGLSLSGGTDATVNGTLTFTAGVISTGSNKMIVTSTGSVARTSGHVFGRLQKNIAAGAGVSRTFEVGDATAANYTPVALTFASVSSARNIVTQAVSGDHPQLMLSTLNASKSVNRYWSLTNLGAAFTTCDAVFHFLTADLDPSVQTAALICGKHEASVWTYPTVGARTANSTEVTGLSAFSDFQLAQPPCATPDVPTLSATVNPTCQSQSTTLSIATGDLNGAANWQWYSGSCGGAAVGTGMSVPVSPAETTTYYARGEGGCVLAPDACASITVIVADNQAPAISCPAAVTVCSNPNTNTYVGTSALHPTVTDNCSSLANVSYILTGATTGASNGLLTGKTFHLNNTTIRYTVTDGNGPGTASCTFVLTVRKSPMPYWQPGSLSVPTGAYNLTPHIKDYRAATKQYKIYQGTPSGSPVCVLTATNGVVNAGQTCTVTHAAPGLYQYYTVAVNDYATGLDCEFTSVALPVTVGPGQTDEGDITIASQDIQLVRPVLYPNPTDGLLYVRFEGSEPDGLHLMLYDTDGRLVLESSGARQLPSVEGATRQFDLNRLPNGVYLFRMVAGVQQYTGRVVKVD